MTEPRKELRNGRYVLLRVLGEGTQGETYEAIDNGVAHAASLGGRAADARAEPLTAKWDRYVELARSDAHSGKGRGARHPGDARGPTSGLVAIKCFRIGRAKQWKDVELAEREARTLASLDHPRLPRYIEHFEEDGTLYLVMEKVEGESVAALRRERTWSADEVTRMLENIADALRYLHGRSPPIVHRDIKPGNILRRRDGSYALVDFGAVRDRLKPAGGSTVVGTFGYMAPEQFQGRASPKSDVYGLGVTALAMLTGCEPEDLPHEGLGIDVRRAVPRGTPTPLVRALASMVVFDPDRRVDSVDEALAFLHASTPRKRGSSDEAPTSSEGLELTKSENRRLRKRQKRADRNERKRLRDAARARSAPLVPRLVAQLGLLLALGVVWLTVGLAVPLVLVILSLLFGRELRRAARACVQAARRTQSSFSNASAWLSGHRRQVTEGPPRVRVASELDPVRAERKSQAQSVATKDITEANALDEAPDRLPDEHLAADTDLEAEKEPLNPLESTWSRVHGAKRRP